MLILRRKAGEQIVLGSDICLTVVAVSGNQVKLGITAPTDVPIRRDELPRRVASSGPFLKDPATPEVRP